MIPRTFYCQTEKVPRIQWPISSIYGEGNRPREEEGLAPGQACRGRRATKLGVRRPGLESLGELGQALFSSLGPTSCGFGLGLRGTWLGREQSGEGCSPSWAWNTCSWW